MLDREEVIEALANYFGIEKDEDTETYNFNSYSWEAGGYLNNRWLSLNTIIRALEDEGLID